MTLNHLQVARAGEATEGRDKRLERSAIGRGEVFEILQGRDEAGFEQE